MESNLLALESLLTAAKALVASLRENTTEKHIREKKKADYLAKKRERKVRKLSKGKPPNVNVVVAVAPVPAQCPCAPPTLPKQKPVVKRKKGDKIICELCKSCVSKSHLKRHQKTKKCLTKQMGLKGVNEIVELSATSGEITLNEEPTEESLGEFFVVKCDCLVGECEC